MLSFVGDLIKDIEDGDCFFIGIVTEVDGNGNVLKYIHKGEVWNGIWDDATNEEIERQWWKIEKI